jgi:hypothetical protein
MHHASAYIRVWDVTNVSPVPAAIVLLESSSAAHYIHYSRLRFYMPLRRTYASLSLDCGTPTNSQSAVHHSSAQPLPTVPSPTPAALQPKVGKPIVKLPTTSSRHRSSLHRSSHPGRQIFPHFKPEPNLYRKVLMMSLKKTDKGREFLRMAKKPAMSEALTANVTTDDQWMVVA